MELLNIHFSFLCRTGRSNKKGQSPLVLRVIHREEKRDIYTGLHSKTEDWDTPNSKVFRHCKQSAAINRNLELINYKAIQVVDESKFSGVLLLSMSYWYDIFLFSNRMKISGSFLPEYSRAYQKQPDDNNLNCGEYYE